MSVSKKVGRSYVLEFAGIPQKKRYKETELEKALKINMEQFLLELGRGFAFIGRQYGISPSVIQKHILNEKAVI